MPTHMKLTKQQGTEKTKVLTLNMVKKQLSYTVGNVNWFFSYEEY